VRVIGSIDSSSASRGSISEIATGERLDDRGIETPSAQGAGSSRLRISIGVSALAISFKISASLRRLVHTHR
jgi:hypothetical protein